MSAMAADAAIYAGNDNDVPERIALLRDKLRKFSDRRSRESISPTSSSALSSSVSRSLNSSITMDNNMSSLTQQQSRRFSDQRDYWGSIFGSSDHTATWTIDDERVVLTAQIDRNNNSPDDWLALIHHERSNAAIKTVLLKLYERATRCMDRDKYQKMPAYVTLWTEYATLQDTQDARDTFKYMLNERIGRDVASFYIAYAQFELRSQTNNDSVRVTKARQILNKGRDHRALPIDFLICALKRLDEGHLNLLVEGEEEKIITTGTTIRAPAQSSSSAHVDSSSVAKTTTTTSTSCGSTDDTIALMSMNIAKMDPDDDPTVITGLLGRGQDDDATASITFFRGARKRHRNMQRTFLTGPARRSTANLSNVDEDTEASTETPIIDSKDNSNVAVVLEPVTTMKSDKLIYEPSVVDKDDEGLVMLQPCRVARATPRKPLQKRQQQQQQQYYQQQRIQQQNNQLQQHQYDRQLYVDGQRQSAQCATPTTPHVSKISVSVNSVNRSTSAQSSQSKVQSVTSMRAPNTSNRPHNDSTSTGQVSTSSPDGGGVQFLQPSASVRQLRERRSNGQDDNSIAPAITNTPMKSPVSEVSMPSMHVQFSQSQPSPYRAAASTPAAGPSTTLAESANDIIVNGKVYTRLELVGKGGSSKVFKVIGPDRKIYAIKRVRLESVDNETVESYINEIELLKRLQNNPNIIRFYDWEVREGESIHMVMQFGDIDLSNLLRKHVSSSEKGRIGGGNIDENHLRLYWQQMLQAVHSIHEQRIIHGDLKPANFIVVEGSLKLIDFGIAKTIQADKTSVFRDTQIGTLNYMSPEAIQDCGATVNRGAGQQLLKMGRPSDVWSLGCILYCMVYNRTPFQLIVNPFAKLQAIVNPDIDIDFPTLQLENRHLMDTLKLTLRRDPAARPTIPELLEHPFLRPEKLLNTIPAKPLTGPHTDTGGLPLSESQLRSLVEQLSRAQVNTPESADSLARAIIGSIHRGENVDVGDIISRNDLTVTAPERAVSSTHQSTTTAKPTLLRALNSNMLRQRQNALQPVAKSKAAAQYMKDKVEEENHDLESLLRKGLECKYQTAIPATEMEPTETCTAGKWDYR